ncbi:MAG: hypothetical protein ACI8W8_003478 [Rhodothermales bacterium]|jgi:hypothetical protein
MPTPKRSQEPSEHRDPEDVLGFVDDKHRQYALQEVSHAQPLVYFLPLLHELFNSTEAKTKILFTVLHALMRDERVQWTRTDLDEKFHWLKDRNWAYLLQRMTAVGWLDFYRDGGTYMISDKGEALMRILSRFSMGPDLVTNEGAAVAEIEFSLLLDAHDVADRLRFLRNRLYKHILRAETALESESPYLIIEIYQQLKSAYRWAEQTRETLDHIQAEDDDTETWNGIRAIHDHLSRLHELISTMQVQLQEIQRKQIDIAQYGLTHLDFDNYLINQNADTLASLLVPHLQKVPHAFLLNEANAFMEAQEVMEREREPPEEMRGWDTDVQEGETTGEGEEPIESLTFTRDLNALPRKWSELSGLVQNETWENAAYRLSLLTLLADRQSRFDDAADAGSGYDPFINLPVQAEFDAAGELVTVPRDDGNWRMTKGQVRRVPRSKSK